jgi:hypothetical protein
MPGGDIYISGAQMLEDLALTRNGVATSTTSVISSSSPSSLSYTHTDTTSESQVTSPSRSSVASRNGFPMHIRADSQTNIWGPLEQVKEPEVFSNGNGHGLVFTSANGHHVNGRRYTNGTQLPDVVEAPNANDAAFAYNASQLPGNGATHMSSPEHSHTAHGIFSHSLAPAVQPIHPTINNRFAQAGEAIQDLP